MKRAVLVIALASAALLPAAAQSNSTTGQDQSGTTSSKYRRKRAKVHPHQNTATGKDQDVLAPPARTPGSSTAAPTPNPANPADPTMPTTTKPPVK